MATQKLASVSVSVVLISGYYVWKLDDDGEFICMFDKLIPRTSHDAWSVRDQFLALKPGEVSAALDFLNRTGAFADGGTGKVFSCPADPGELWQFQSLVGLYLQNDPREWAKVSRGYPKKLLHRMQYRGLPQFYMDWSGEVPTAVISAGFTLPALLATIQIDKWRQARHRKCAKPDCWRVFEIEGGRKNKIYCDVRCAQHQAMRGYRKRIALKKIAQENLEST